MGETGASDDHAALALTVLRTARVGYIVTDRNIVNQWVNPMMGELLDMEPERLVGTSPFVALHPDEVSFARAVVDQLLIEPGGLGRADFGVPLRVRMRRADGAYTTYEVAGIPVDEGVIDGLVLRVRPLRGQHLVDEALHEMARGAPLGVIVDLLVVAMNDLLERDRAVRVFVDGVALGDAVVSGDRAAPPVHDPFIDLASTPEFALSRWARDLPQPLRDDTLAGGWERVWALAVPASPGVRIVVWRASGHELPLSTQAAAARIADVIGLAIDRDAALTQIRYAAEHDALTGLENRGRFVQRLAEVVDQAKTGLLFVDLDDFKAVNDRYGHAAGDAALQEVAARIGGAVRPGDVVARLGGDEFAILCTDPADRAAALAVAHAVVRAVAEPLAVGDDLVTVGASIGVAVGTPGTAATGATLLERADVALYRAKGLGRGCVAIAD